MCFSGKKFVCYKPDSFDYVEFDWIYEVNSNTTLIEIKQIGICSSDFDRLYEGKAHMYPITIGHEIIGEVVETHPDSSFARGDLVTVFPLLPCYVCKSCVNSDFNLCEDYSYYGSRQSGGLSTFFEVSNSNLKIISSSIEGSLLSAIEPMSVVIHAFRKLCVGTQGLILTGSGFLTYLAYLYGKFVGVERILIETSNSTFLSILDEASRLDATEDLLVTRCLDFSGGEKTLEKIVMALSPKGQIVTIANSREDTVISSRARNFILRKELAIFGSWNSTFATEDSDWDEAIAFLSKVKDFKFPLESIHFDDFGKFLELNDRNSTIGKRIYVYF